MFSLRRFRIFGPVLGLVVVACAGSPRGPSVEGAAASAPDVTPLPIPSARVTSTTPDAAPATVPAVLARDAAWGVDAFLSRPAFSTGDGSTGDQGRSDAGSSTPLLGPPRADGTACQSARECVSGFCLGAICSPASVARGLVGYWRFDEDTPNTVSDSSGRGNHGRAMGGPVSDPNVPIAPFPDPRSLRLDGRDDLVTIPDAIPLRLGDDLTIAFWFWKSSEAATETRIVGKGTRDRHTFAFFEEAGTARHIVFRQTPTTGTGVEVISTSRTDVGRWYHIAVTVSGTAVVMYIDGVEDARATRPLGSVMLPTDPIIVGCTTPPSCFPGLIDDLRLYDRALPVPDLRLLAQTRIVPVLWIETGTPAKAIVDDPKISGRLKIIEDHDGTLVDIGKRAATLDTPIGIEQHGDTSRTFPKKSYGIEVRNAMGVGTKTPILGMPADTDWVLYACYSDKTCLRNALTYAIGRELNVPSPRAAFAEIFIDGKNEGLYLVVESVKTGTNRLPLPSPAKDSSGDLTGGYIVKRDGVRRDWVSKLGVFWSHAYPKVDRITAPQRTYIRDHIDKFEAAMKGTDWAHETRGYSQWIDTKIWIDYLMMQELSRNADAYRKSTYVYKRPMSQDGKLGLGPLWDFDIGYGNVDVPPRWGADGWAHKDNPTTNAPDFFFFEKIWTDPAFKNAFSCRWNEVRRNILSQESFDRRLKEWTFLLRRAEPRDHQRWQILGTKVWPNYFVGKTFMEEINYLHDWIKDHLAYMDKTLPGSCAN